MSTRRITASGDIVVGNEDTDTKKEDPVLESRTNVFGFSFDRRELRIAVVVALLLLGPKIVLGLWILHLVQSRWMPSHRAPTSRPTNSSGGRVLGNVRGLSDLPPEPPRG